MYHADTGALASAATSGGRLLQQDGRLFASGRNDDVLVRSMPQEIVCVNAFVTTQRPKVGHTFESERMFCRAIVRISMRRH